MPVKRFANGNRLNIQPWCISLVLPGNAGRFYLKPEGYSGNGAFRDPQLLTWASNYVAAQLKQLRGQLRDTPSAVDQAAMEGLAAFTLEEMHATIGWKHT